MTPTCSDCGKQITLQSKTGRCRKHALAATLSNRDVEERRRIALAIVGNDPANRRQNSERMKAYCRNPEVRAKRSADSRRIMHLTIGCENARRAALSPETIRKRAATFSRKRIAWCPPDRVEEYRSLVRRKGLRSAEAKRIILESLTTFERQLHAVRSGAGIVNKPVLRPREYDFTLGGVSSMDGG